MLPSFISLNKFKFIDYSIRNFSKSQLIFPSSRILRAKTEVSLMNGKSLIPISIFISVGVINDPFTRVNSLVRKN